MNHGQYLVILVSCKYKEVWHPKLNYFCLFDHSFIVHFSRYGHATFFVQYCRSLAPKMIVEVSTNNLGDHQNPEVILTSCLNVHALLVVSKDVKRFNKI